MNGRIVILLTAGFLAIGVSLSIAQIELAPPVRYKLDDDSTFQRGCFEPCLCPIMEAAPVRGTFRLVPAGNDGLFALYKVTQVYWKTSLGGQDVLITGSGTYRIGGEFALQHELSLDLSVGDDPPEHFDSGLVTPSTPFPRIDVEISINGGYCFDTVIDVHSRPARKQTSG